MSIAIFYLFDILDKIVLTNVINYKHVIFYHIKFITKDMNNYRTHNCGELSKENIGKKVIISGWLNKKRDHGKLFF